MEITYGNSKFFEENQKNEWLKYRKRTQVDDILFFLENIDDTRFIGVVSGLSMTGKTTILQQAMASLPNTKLQRAAFLDIDRSTSWIEIRETLNKLHEKGYKYIFIDEITENKNYIKNCSELANIFLKTKCMKLISYLFRLKLTFSLFFIARWLMQ